MLALKSKASESYQYQIIDIQYLSADVICLTLQAIHGAGMTYQSGQFLSIALPDDDYRCYSMASSYAQNGVIELHIRIYANGKFSTHLTSHLTKGDVLSVQGPYGDCVWPVDIVNITHTVMLATGTGIAPLKAIIEDAVHQSAQPNITLICGGHKKEDIYLYAFFDDLAKRYAHFQFIPVLNAQAVRKTEIEWNGKTGLIQEVASQLFPDMSAMQVFACGSPTMVNAAKSILTEKNHLAPHHFHADAFEIAAPQNIVSEKHHQEKIVVQAYYPNGAYINLNLNTGQSLMTALQEHKILRGVCGGKAMCGTCSIALDKAWHTKLLPMQRSEKRLLQTLIPQLTNIRLACQIQLESRMHGLILNIPPNQF